MKKSGQARLLGGAPAALLLGVFLFATLAKCFGLGDEQIVEEVKSGGSFTLAADKFVPDIFVDPNDFPGVLRAAHDFQRDIFRVTGVSPVLAQKLPVGREIILIGTIGKSLVLDRIIRERHIDVSAVAGKWESYLIQNIPAPLPGVDHALLIAGSDKRGTIYGIYHLSEQIGVSPWYWWADVPARRHDALFVKAGPHLQGPPSVKYRGIFLNDEAPDLSNWVREKYGSLAGIPGDPANYGHAFYTNIFELILRLKGNYLWPAMWNNAFNEDDPENPRLADEYGIVMGTSHQEPMLRAQKEWDRTFAPKYGGWNFATEPDVLERFWRDGLKRNKNYESIITIGLRGANDTPMAEGGPETNKNLLETIIGAQRKLIAEELNPDPAQVPQLWCLYKEVLGFYNAGMRVPDDVTLLWTDDNWGNLRRLPTAGERKRSGGAGIYYHFDYHGGPRSYQWINTSPLPKIWDQMSLAKEYGADRIWIVNVGHLKGYEFPLEYFMDMAWNSDRWTNNNIEQYTRLWAGREFGPDHASDIADIIAKETKYNGRRKPELLDAQTYSLVNYQEAEKVVADFNALTARAERIYQQLPASSRNAFYELVLFPTKASAELNAMYLAAARNALFASQRRAGANEMAADTHRLFEAQTNLMNDFNHTFANGKWDHFMDQSYIGYHSWADPPHNNMSAIHLANVELPEAALMGVAAEGAGNTLPRFDAFNRQRHYIDLFNEGKTPFDFTVTASDPWILVDRSRGTVGQDQRIWITIQWDKMPSGISSGTVTVNGAGRTIPVKVEAWNTTNVTPYSLQGFMEGDGYVSIEAEHYAKKTDDSNHHWTKIDDYGRTLSGMRASAPPDAGSAEGTNSPCLEYRMYLSSTGTFEVTAILGSTLNFVPGRGLRYAISFDDQPPQIITAVPADYSAQNGNKDWEKTVEENARATVSSHTLRNGGYHTLKFWMVDPGVVLEKLVVNLGGVRPSYLGPPESFRVDREAARAVAAADRQRMMDLLHLPAPGSLPDPADDPRRPVGTHPKGHGSPNWSDDVPGQPRTGHTIARSPWGNWSNYDLKKADLFPLPDPLLLKNGQRVTDAQTWWSERRPEILNDFFTEIYGRIPANTPKVTWETTHVDTNIENGLAVTITLVGRVDNSSDPDIAVNIEMTLTVPAHSTRPVPVIIVIGGQGSGPMKQLLARGWGYATFSPASVQTDGGAGLREGIIGLVNHGEPRSLDDWGALAAWSWGLSRCLDYLETDPDVDAKKVGLEGHSRWGKEALVAMAFDPRFAIAYSSCSGEGGAKLHRHDVGESVDNVASDGEYHWMAGNFLKYGGYWNELPVDAHELIGLCAPRPIFVTGGTADQWSDPVGEFKACVAAGPIYRLLGKKDVGATEMPAPDVALISGDIGFREHLGGHTDVPDWPAFLQFADKYF